MMTIGLKLAIWLFLIIAVAASCSGRLDAPGSSSIGPGRTTEVGRRPATFTESFLWSDGVAVEVVEIEHTRLLATTTVDAPDAKAGDPCSELTIVVRNNSDHQVRVALSARLRFGTDLTTTATAYVASPGHAEHAIVQHIPPGEISYPYTVGFVLPRAARHNVLLEVGIDNWKHERAVFAGTLT